MKKKNIYYDKKIDALWIRMKKGEEVDSEEIAPGMTVEYDVKGDVIGVEILHASRLFSGNKLDQRRIIGARQFA